MIAARSYVNLLAGSAQNPEETRPDDLSPRDRVGHGTAVAGAAAANTVAGPLATISGVAPKAYIGNYKVFGSPGVNDFATTEAIITALEDAVRDGMDIAILSLGGPALTEPLASGDECGLSPGLPCDLEAVAVENAIRLGLTVVAAAGNEGDIGDRTPTLGTLGSPATAPSAIAVAATTNSHVFTTAISVNGASVPASLERVPSVFGNGPRPAEPVTGPVRDIRAVSGDSLACSSLPAGALQNAIALVERGDCTFAIKAANVSEAGAAGMILYLSSNADDLFTPGGLERIRMPVVLIAREQGLALANLAAQNPSLVAVITPGLAEVSTGAPERITDFSSLGPSIGLRDLKPEIAATGTSMYMPMQSFDPAGAMYNPSGYTVSSGTSFSAPLVAGAVALVKQRNPGFTPLQLKSAVVNTSDREVIVPGSVTDVLATGAGKLHAGAAVGTTLTVEPSTVSFGVIAKNSLPATQQFVLSNRSTIARNVQLAVQPRNMPGQTQLSLSENHLLLHPVRRGRSRSHCRAGPPRADLTAERSRSKALRQSSTCPACS